MVKIRTNASIPVGIRGSGLSIKELATRGEGSAGGTEDI